MSISSFCMYLSPRHQSRKCSGLLAIVDDDRSVFEPSALSFVEDDPSVFEPSALSFVEDDPSASSAEPRCFAVLSSVRVLTRLAKPISPIRRSANGIWKLFAR